MNASPSPRRFDTTPATGSVPGQLSARVAAGRGQAKLGPAALLIREQPGVRRDADRVRVGRNDPGRGEVFGHAQLDRGSRFGREPARRRAGRLRTIRRQDRIALGRQRRQILRILRRDLRNPLRAADYVPNRLFRSTRGARGPVSRAERDGHGNAGAPCVHVLNDLIVRETRRRAAAVVERDDRMVAARGLDGRVGDASKRIAIDEAV